MPSRKDYWTPKRKKDAARRMILSGHSNDQIKEHLRKQCDSAISSEALADIRAKLGKSGSNRKKKTNNKPKQKKKRKFDEVDLMLLQGQDLDPHLKELLSTVKDAMIAQGVHKLEIDHLGHVKASQLQDLALKV